MDNDARARAEARRQKILARQKDRLSTITGVYQEPTAPAPVAAQGRTAATASGVEDQAMSREAAAAAPPLPTSATTLSAAAGQESATDQEQPHPAQLQEQQMAALLAAATASLQQAQSAIDTPGVSSAQSIQQDILQTILRESPAADLGPHAPQQGQQQQQQQQIQQEVSWVMKLGPLLSTAVKHTQLLRLLSALLLAYAVLSGLDTGIPPAIFVIVTDSLIVASAIVVFSGTSYGQRLAAADAAKAAEGRDLQVPLRLRSFDVLALLPGLREVLNVLSGYRMFTDALSEDVAVYVVGLGLTTLFISSGMVA